ncbi:MAG: dihydrolipoamide acetyltransferase family protein [Chitinispirillaceae bacterium]
MAEKIVMLALSPTMELGTIARWVKKEGDEFRSGDVLCEVETDKATMDYESVNEGTLLKIVAGEGSRVKVGDTIAIAGAPGEDFSGLVQEPVKKPSEAEKKEALKEREKESPVRGKEEKAPEGKKEPSGAEPARGRPPEGVKASPLARETAKREGIDIRSVEGSGPGGRIIREDVEEYVRHRAEAGPAAAVPGIREEIVPLTERRRVIAQRLSESKYSSPHFYLTVVVKADTLLVARKELNSHREKSVSLNSFMIKFVSEALKRHPQINASWQEDSIKRFGTVDIGLAVALKEGLVTPVVRNCSTKGILQIDGELRALVQKARDGKLSMEEYTNATFTISNLGAWGVRQFTAIINPPASAILAVGEVFREPVVDESGNIDVQSSMNLTLSCDHRVIDGATAAEFARDLKGMFENPMSVLY